MKNGTMVLNIAWIILMIYQFKNKILRLRSFLICKRFIHKMLKIVKWMM